MGATAVRIMLLTHGITASAIARDLNCSVSVVSEVVSMKRRTPWVRRGVSAALGMSFDDVWGTPDPGFDRFRPGRPTANTFAENGTARGAA